MSKIKNAILVIVAIIVAIVFVIFRKNTSDLTRAMARNRIRRRRNTIDDLEKKRGKLEERIKFGNDKSGKVKMKLDQIIKKKEELKETTKKEVEEMDDEGLAKELGDLLNSL